MPGFFDKLKANIFGAAPEHSGHTEFDGIIHKGSKHGKPDPIGLPLAMAEMSAVAQAIRHIGDVTNDPAEFRKLVLDYVRRAARFVKLHPDSILSKHYVDKAKQLKAPDAQSAEKGHEGRYNTVDTIGPAGKELGAAAVPLIRFLNKLHSHVELSALFTPAKKYDNAPSREEAPPPDIDLADEGHEEPTFTTSAPKERDIPRGDAPIPIAALPGELGARGSRWQSIHDHITRGAGKEDIIKHLMGTYLITRKKASDTIRRFLASKSNTTGVTKLARPLQAEELTKTSRFPLIAGSRLAYHLLKIAESLHAHHPELAQLALDAVNQKHSKAVGDPYKKLGETLDLLHSKKMDEYRRAREDGRIEDARRIKQELESDARYKYTHAYQWQRMNEGLLHDSFVDHFLRDPRFVNFGGNPDELHVAAANQFDLTRGKAKSGKPDLFNQFWERLHKAAQTYGGGILKGVTREKLNEALLRLSDRAVEREELRGGKGFTPAQVQKQEKQKTPDQPHVSHWREAFGWLPGSQHMKFRRDEQEMLIRLARYDVRIRESIERVYGG